MFITFEGLDGAGKSTQVELLAARLAQDGRKVVATRDPAGTELGAHTRRLVLDGPPMSAWAEAALFAAARAQLVDEVIRPALVRGADVICDRYLDSAVAYQGEGRELGIRRVLQLNVAPTQGLLPDRTFLLVLDPDEARRRSGGWASWIERENQTFRNGCVRGYREVARLFPDRVVVVDAARTREEIAREVYERIRELF